VDDAVAKALAERDAADEAYIMSQKSPGFDMDAMGGTYGGRPTPSTDPFSGNATHGYATPLGFLGKVTDEVEAGAGPGQGPGEGDATVICTALHDLGILPDDIYNLDVEFGQLVNSQDPDLGDGYRAWATPVAEYIKGSSLGSRAVRAVVAPIAKSWAAQMAHVMRPEEYKSNICGRLIMAVGHPICRSIGKCLTAKTKEA